MCSRSIIPRFDWLQGVSLLHYSAPFQFQGVRHLNGPPPLNVHLHSANCAPINVKMTMGQNLLAVAAFLLLAHSVTADLIPTYRDEAEETGRIGVISLSGSTANYTINLTGIILLGLALSAAVTLWAYLHTLFGKGYGGSYGGSYAAASTYTDTYAANTYKLSSSGSVANYTINLTGIILLGLGVAAATMFWIHLANVGSKGGDFKRSVEDDASATLPIVLANMHQRFEDSEINDMPCRQRVMCEAAHPKNHFAQNTFGHAVNAFFRLVEDDEEMMKQVEGDKRATKYLAAWIEGKRGKSCKAAYEKCSMTFSRVDALLKSE